MENLSPEAKQLIDLIDKKEKLVAMLAPSFVVVFEPMQVIGMLKRIGFKYVIEVARGAEETNKQLLALMKLHPDKRYITNPCPTVVRTIRNRFPQLIGYLAPIDSPMVATAKITAKKYPGFKKVFIGPCALKKLEAKEDYPELDILSITYNKKVVVNLMNWKQIISDRKWIELLNDFNCLRKGGNKNNMGKKPTKKGTKKGQ